MAHVIRRVRIAVRLALAVHRLLRVHDGAIIDNVYLLIDDCVYDLPDTDQYTPIEQWRPLSD